MRYTGVRQYDKSDAIGYLQEVHAHAGVVKVRNVF